MPISASGSAVGVAAPAAGSRGLARLEGPRDDGRRLVEVERLDQVVEGAPLHRPHGGLQVAEGRDDDDRRGADALAERAHRGQAVHARQADVEHDGVERARAGDLQALLDRGGDLHVVPLVGERLAERPADARLVVDDQDAAHAAPRGVSARCGKVRRKRVSPSSRVQDSRPPWSAATRWARARPEPDALGLARDERLAQGFGQLGRRPRPGVGHLDGHLVADRPIASSRTVPPGPAASMAFNVRFKSAARTPAGSARTSSGPSPRRCREGHPGVLARRVDQEGDIREEPPQVADAPAAAARPGRARAAP